MLELVVLELVVLELVVLELVVVELVVLELVVLELVVVELVVVELVVVELVVVELVVLELVVVELVVVDEPELPVDCGAELSAFPLFVSGTEMVNHCGSLEELAAETLDDDEGCTLCAVSEVLLPDVLCAFADDVPAADVTELVCDVPLSSGTGSFGFSAQPQSIKALKIPDKVIS